MKDSNTVSKVTMVMEIRANVREVFFRYELSKMNIGVVRMIFDKKWNIEVSKSAVNFGSEPGMLLYQSKPFMIYPVITSRL
jgi:hypothetical protein